MTDEITKKVIDTPMVQIFVSKYNFLNASDQDFWEITDYRPG